jgi:hypothetical protein
MAKIWFVRDGSDPTTGDHWAEMPIDEAARLFALKPSHFLSPLSSTPRFGNATRDFWLAGYRHLVVEIDDSEPARGKWKSGFYRSPVAPAEAFARLIRPEIEKVLGERNVLEVETRDGRDMEGEAVLVVDVVLTPKAAEWRGKVNPVAVSLGLTAYLERIGLNRQTIVQYSTKAERAQAAVA